MGGGCRAEPTDKTQIKTRVPTVRESGSYNVSNRHFMAGVQEGMRSGSKKMDVTWDAG